MRTIEGIVTVVQESRLRLTSPDGRGHLFLISPSSGIETQDLPDLARRQARVRIEFEPHDGLVAGIAYALETLGRNGAAP